MTIPGTGPYGAQDAAVRRSRLSPPWRAGIAAIGLGGLVYRAWFGPSSQLMGQFPYQGETTEKVVALTFDDGPNEPYTSRLVDLLGDKGVSATFFQVGRCVERHPGLPRRMAEAGHVIGNHTYGHRFSSYLSQPSLRDEMAHAQRVIAADIGRSPALFRPPWLCHQPPLLTEAPRQGLQVVSGRFAHPLEVAQPAARRIARWAVTLARPGAILIFHDGREARGGNRAESVSAAAMVIEELADRGFTFTTVDRLLGVPAYQDGKGRPGGAHDGLP